MGDDKGLILFAELHKLWLSHAKSLQENRLLKTETVEQNKNFKSHNFNVGQLIVVKITWEIHSRPDSFQIIEN